MDFEDRQGWWYGINYRANGYAQKTRYDLEIYIRFFMYGFDLDIRGHGNQCCV